MTIERRLQAFNATRKALLDEMETVGYGGQAMTEMGMIIGTAAYMAPEQARGRAVDRRADIWAFGAVLFEMLTGQRAFPGDDLTDTLAAVVKLDPAWETLPPDVPDRVRRVLHARRMRLGRRHRCGAVRRRGWPASWPFSRPARPRGISSRFPDRR